MPVVPWSKPWPSKYLQTLLNVPQGTKLPPNWEPLYSSEIIWHQMFAFMPSPAALQVSSLVQFHLFVVCLWLVSQTIYNAKYMISEIAPGQQPTAASTHAVSPSQRRQTAGRKPALYKVTRKTIPKDGRTIGPCSSANHPHEVFFLTRAAYKNKSSLPQSSKCFQWATAHNLNLRWKAATGNTERN